MQATSAGAIPPARHARTTATSSPRREECQNPAETPRGVQEADSVIGEDGSYVLESGQVVVSAEPLRPGDVAVWVKRLNQTLFAECNEMHVPDPEQELEQYDYMMGNLYLEEDVVVGKV